MQALPFNGVKSRSRIERHLWIFFFSWHRKSSLSSGSELMFDFANRFRTGSVSGLINSTSSSAAPSGCAATWVGTHLLKPHKHTQLLTGAPARITASFPPWESRELFSAFIYMWHKTYFEERKLVFFFIFLFPSFVLLRGPTLYFSRCAAAVIVRLMCFPLIFFFFFSRSRRKEIGRSAGVHGGCDLAKTLDCL